MAPLAAGPPVPLTNDEGKSFVVDSFLRKQIDKNHIPNESTFTYSK